MAAGNFYDIFADALATGTHTAALGSADTDTVKLALSDTAPDFVNDTTFSTHAAEISATGGYTAGGIDIVNTHSNSVGAAGVLSLVVGLAADQAIWTDSGSGTFPAARYFILWNSTVAGAGDMMGVWDYGSSFDLTADQTMTVTLADPILTVTAT